MPLVCGNFREDEKDLWKDPIPGVEIESEKPWHRLAILLAAQGHTVGEIATKLERNHAWVSNLLRQDWARERLTTEINLAGRDEIATILKSAGPSALRRVISLSETADSDAVRLAANKEVLDRLLGKAVQVVDSQQKVTLNLKDVDRELAALEEQEKALGLSINRMQPEGGSNVSVTSGNVSVTSKGASQASGPLYQESDEAVDAAINAALKGKPLSDALYGSKTVVVEPVQATPPDYFIKPMDN